MVIFSLNKHFLLWNNGEGYLYRNNWMSALYDAERLAVLAWCAWIHPGLHFWTLDTPSPLGGVGGGLEPGENCLKNIEEILKFYFGGKSEFWHAIQSSWWQMGR